MEPNLNTREPFADRREAGTELAAHLHAYKDRHDVVVLALAVQAVRAHAPARIVVAVPVGAPDTCGQFADIAAEIICAHTPEPFSSVGQWYRDFSETTDEDVRGLLHESAEPAARTR